MASAGSWLGLYDGYIYGSWMGLYDGYNLLIRYDSSHGDLSRYHVAKACYLSTRDALFGPGVA